MVALMPRNQNIFSLSVYSTRNLTIPPYITKKESQRGFNISASESCGKTFKKVKRINEHVESCGISFACDQCDREFGSKKIYGHMKAKHTNEFRCIICEKCFESQSRLNRHQTTRNKIAKVNYPNCSKRFSRKDTLIKHMNEKHGL